MEECVGRIGTAEGTKRTSNKEQNIEQSRMSKANKTRMFWELESFGGKTNGLGVNSSRETLTVTLPPPPRPGIKKEELMPRIKGVCVRSESEVEWV